LQGSRLETRVGLFVLAALGIFIYMGFQIGAFRFDKNRYNPYIMYFKDISGLARKGEVKIAGVKVGWVDEIKLVPERDMRVQARVMILKDYALYDDAYAIVRQDGMLGPKYLEIVPGDPLLRPIERGGTLGKPSVEPVSVDELLHKFKAIATNVETITDSLRDTMGGAQGHDQLQSIFDNLRSASEHFSSFSTILDRAFARNENNLDSLLEIGNNIRTITQQLENDVLPSIRNGIDKISGSFDRNLDRVADSFGATAKALEDASLEAREGFASLSSVTEKIDEGKGLLGKLINDDDTYRDIKTTVEGLKNYFARVNSLQIVFDAHGESMRRPAENYRYEDSKFYFDMRIHPNEDYFYVVGVASTEKGTRAEREVIKTFFRQDDLPVPAVELPPVNFITPPDKYRQREDILTRNTFGLDLQFGKIFTDIAFRIGLFEGYGGVAMDVDIPLRNDNFRWVTSLEAFDIRGWNRLHDRRPHLKWLNRMFLFRNIYFTFGADDFVSRHNGNIFFGVGLRFSDDDIKYFLPSLGGAAGLASTS
jgi:phospholipid/cholesterol/gamma-HCH transport system substrate-binding protein